MEDIETVVSTHHQTWIHMIQKASWSIAGDQLLSLFFLPRPHVSARPQDDPGLLQHLCHILTLL